jgi:hypothetical protein
MCLKQTFDSHSNSVTSLSHGYCTEKSNYAKRIHSVCHLMVFSVLRLHSTRRKGNRGMMINWKGLGRTQLWPNHITMPPFSWGR